MSHWICRHCGGRFRDAHECDVDPEVMAGRIFLLEQELQSVKETVYELSQQLSALVKRTI